MKLRTNRIAPVALAATLALGLAACDVDDDPDTTVVEDNDTVVEDDSTDAGTDEEMTEDTETEDEG